MKRREVTLTTQLALWFERPIDDLPDELRALVRRRFMFCWDRLSPAQRKYCAQQWDWQYPVLALERAEAERQFRRGFMAVVTPPRRKRANTLNGKRPRPARQKLSDDKIRVIAAVLLQAGVPAHKRCGEAYRRLAPPMTRQCFRRRWTAIHLKRRMEP